MDKNAIKALEFAITWAKKRWGARGHAWHPRNTVPGDPTRCALGVKEGENEHQWVVRGVGQNWAEATADAVARETKR